MIKPLLLLSVLLLVGCGSTPELIYVNKRILTDKNGCAFLVQKTNNERLAVLIFQKSESQPDCPLVKFRADEQLERE